MKDKKLNFKEFLQENGVDTKLFAENCLKENHGWSYSPAFAKHTDIHTLGYSNKSRPSRFLRRAFNFHSSLLPNRDELLFLANAWETLCNTTPYDTIEFGFIKYSLGDIYER